MSVLTQKQAWKYIGDCFYTPRRERTGRQYGVVNLVGICHAVKALYENGGITITTKGNMMRDIWADSAIRRNPINDFYAYFCSPYLRRNDLLRADFCYMQYYMLGGE